MESLKSQVTALHEQISKLHLDHKAELAKYSLQIEKLNEDRAQLQETLKDYRCELARLTNPETRQEAMGELSTSLSRVSDYIADTEDSKKVQIKMMG
jgi:hypothetical protein